jgi:hypothetical protein
MIDPNEEPLKTALALARDEQWSYTRAKGRRSSQEVRDRILTSLANCGSAMTPLVLAACCRRSIGTTRTHLRDLVREGKIKAVRCHVGEGFRGAFILCRLTDTEIKT